MAGGGTCGLYLLTHALVSDKGAAYLSIMGYPPFKAARHERLNYDAREKTQTDVPWFFSL